MRRLLLVLAVFLALPSVASAAQLIDRNAANVHIVTNAKGEALLTYTKAGATKHVLIWGAVNALAPTQSGHQVKFKLDYSGGWGKYHTLYWKTFTGTCGKYDGPAIPNMVAACKAADGSYWAAQSWQQPLPDLGFTPWRSDLNAYWLEVSHWTGPIAQLEVHQGWVYGSFQQIFGRFTYNGSPVYGFGTTNVGAPTDNFGRLIYLDTHDSVYGTGWRRENSFVPHNPTGAFCYGFYSFDPTKGGYQHPAGATAKRGPGVGDEYRLTASGPGVTPNVSVTVPAVGAYDGSDSTKVALKAEMDNLLRSYGDRSCGVGLG
jgi:hypothetical protein